jgi:tyrosine-protein phosphatase SIW14
MIVFIARTRGTRQVSTDALSNDNRADSSSHKLDTSNLNSTVRNFHEVTPFLYRGGQPGHEGITELANAGMKTIICLRWGAKTIAAEKAAVEAAGMKFISIPMYYWRLPGIDVTAQFLELVDNEQNWPLFVHCFHGADRTGLLVAMYRITRQSWHVDDAYKEMKACGFHRFRIRHFKWKLYQYARALTV